MKLELPLTPSVPEGQGAFCILPWKKLEVTNIGTVFCC